MARFKQRRLELIERASERWDVDLSGVPIVFNLRGRAAGMVQIRPPEPHVLRINRDLFERFPDEIIDDTLGHEMAHVVVLLKWGRQTRPHGREWQAVMWSFDQEPKRCHQMETTKARQTKTHPAECGCGQITEVGVVRAKRIRTGAKSYRCTRCRERVRLIVEDNRGA
jgi:SprT protein